MKALALAPVAIAVAGLTSVSEAQGITPAAPDTSYVSYSESPISLPLGVGLRIPTYDRVNGLALPWGPKLELGDGRLDVDALVTYRSNLGKWDPSLEGSIRPGDENDLSFFAGRGTFTNDAWIRGDLTNSAAAFFVGSDSRNYYRADRATARIARTFTSNSVTLAPFVGGNVERDWSTGSLVPSKSPWSFFGRKGNLKMRRPNPRVASGSIASALGGAALQVVRGDLEGKLDASLEKSVRTALKPDCAGVPVGGFCAQPQPGSSFTQATLDGHISFPTFGTETFAFMGHAVITGGSGITPAQRFAYLGGSGTLATVDLLALGGDRLLFVQGDYTIPIDQIQLPFAGSPYVALRYAAGNAGVGGLPALIQNVGVGVGVSFFRADYSIDPAQNRSPFSRRSAFSVGVSLSL
ncbi:MAG TPA: hypothetical protein VN876_02630 [Gemmatimonadaceae bacterium]|nr:hypothetical protein [Gemmatimonadaceae bacterium]